MITGKKTKFFSMKSYFLIAILSVLLIVVVMVNGKDAFRGVDVPSWIGSSETLALPEIGKPFVNSIGIEFCWIPPGKFKMGDEKYLRTRFVYETTRPPHLVEIRKGFWMSKYEVTQGSWRLVMGEKAYRYSDDDKRPVTCLTWHQCNDFCRKLSKLEGLNYRLPSEAQWEYACQNGDYDFETMETRLRRVGQYPPNGFGLYDMVANAGEWCSDVWYPNYKNAPSDGSPRTHGNSRHRVIRGGLSFNRSTKEDVILRYGKASSYSVCGFRLLISQYDVNKKRQRAELK